MPGPVRYTEKGKVKKSAPRKYESGKGWSDLTPKEQASPSVPSARKSRIRKATGPIGPQGFSRQSQRRSSILAEINRQQDTRKTNQEALGFVGDALAKVAKVVTAEPQTDFEKGIAPLTAVLPTLGMVKGNTVFRGATVKGVEGLRRHKAAEYTIDRKFGEKTTTASRNRENRLREEAMDRVRREGFSSRRKAKDYRREARADSQAARRTYRRRNRRWRSPAEKQAARKEAYDRNEMKGWLYEEQNASGPGT